MARIVLTTFGSLGDLHPYLAVGIGLRRRGHEVTLVTSEAYRPKIEGEGLRFHASEPDLGRWLDDPDAFRKAHDVRWGSKFVMCEMILPYLRQSYEALLAAAEGCDLIVGHALAYSTPLVAEKLGKRWVQVGLQPMVWLSVDDPPVFAPAPWLRSLRNFSRTLYELVFRAMSFPVRIWARPVDRLRRELGLAPATANPMMRGAFSPYANLSWFSRAFAEPQADWPVGSDPLGFAFYDRLLPGQDLPTGLSAFLDAGEPPVVFTLGSAAVMDAGNFYMESLSAIRKSGRRAVFVVGVHDRNRLPEPLPAGVFVAGYAPYSALFPRAAVNVHQGGVGTTAQALRAGRPMIVVPFSHDQPDNAYRVTKLGCGRTIARHDYSAASVLRALDGMEALKPRAADVGATITREDGLSKICKAVEAQSLNKGR